MKTYWDRERPSGDGGFTLIELLITIAIMGLITIPLGNFVIEYFRYTADSAGQLSESHDAQISAAYFAHDVESLGTRDQASQTLQQSVFVGSAAGSPYQCGSVTPVVLFVSDQFSSAGAQTIVEVAYNSVTVGTERQLQRILCAGPGASPVTSVVAHDIDPSQAPAVTCFLNGIDPVDSVMKPLTAACNGTGSSVPSSVQMKLQLKDPRDSGSSYVVTLTGTRRQT